MVGSCRFEVSPSKEIEIEARGLDLKWAKKMRLNIRNTITDCRHILQVPNEDSGKTIWRLSQRTMALR